MKVCCNTGLRYHCSHSGSKPLSGFIFIRWSSIFISITLSITLLSQAQQSCSWQTGCVMYLRGFDPCVWIFNPLTAHHNAAGGTTFHFASLGQTHEKKEKFKSKPARKPSRGRINIDEFNISCLCSAPGGCGGAEAQRWIDGAADHYRTADWV